MSSITEALESAGLISPEKARVQESILPLVRERRMLLKEIKEGASKPILIGQKRDRVSIITTQVKSMNKQLNRL